MVRCGRQERRTPMTTRGSKEPAVVEIDGFRGRLIRSHHPDYDIARALWNGALDRRPRLIARCVGTADVVAAVRFARAHDLEIAIRGGGHNVAGTAVCDDGIVIDLSAMRAVRVEPADRRAWVQGGALWGDVDHETQAYGLATTGGIVSHTGVAGLTLGGGIGWLMRKHGLAVDNLLAADVVTAEGELLRASADARSSVPSAVTTSAATRLSIVRPCLRISQPMPPPRVSPATPV